MAVEVTVEVEHVCDRVLAVTAPEGFAPALGVPLRAVEGTDAVTSFEGTFFSGAFSRAELRVNRESGLVFLVLELRAGAGVHLANVNLGRYGSAPSAIDNNLEIPPEGTMAYSYDVHGVRITFQFTARSKLLRVVSFEWPPRG